MSDGPTRRTETTGPAVGNNVLQLLTTSLIVLLSAAAAAAPRAGFQSAALLASIVERQLLSSRIYIYIRRIQTFRANDLTK